MTGKYMWLPLLATLAGTSSIADELKLQQISLGSCFLFPKVTTENIVNNQGDRTELRKSDEFQTDYFFQSKDKIRMYTADDDKGLAHEDIEVIRNSNRHFRGDTIASVKNQMENFIRVRHSQECKSTIP